ncbi:FAS-associated death domain protein-like [Asterias amurensis]|uniref:FAS-associated death domain protein-like n=1 Tax=Asterias amurensis TaxID=7602 RepID=UPI003AB5C78B
MMMVDTRLTSGNGTSSSMSSGSAFKDTKKVQYRRVLSDIASKLNAEDIKTMRFICKAVDGLSKRDLELEDPLDFFQKLEDRGVMSDDDTSFFRELLDMVHRPDCMALLDGYERSRSATEGAVRARDYLGQRVSTDAVCEDFRNLNVHVGMPGPHKIRGPIQQPIEVSFGEDLSEAFEIVVEELGRDWRQLARRLQLTETEIDFITENHMRDLREQSMQCLVVWKKKMRTRATKAALIEALKRCKMMYISDRLEGLQVR